MLLSPWIIGVIGALAAGTGSPRPLVDVRRDADTAYAERSWRLARQLYGEAEAQAPEKEKRRLHVLVLDTTWRAANTIYERTAYEASLALSTIAAGEPRDDTWSLATASLVDYHIARTDVREALKAAGPVLAFWESRWNEPGARERYLSLVFRIGQAIRSPSGTEIPVPVLERCVSEATNPEQRILFNVFLARELLFGEGGRPSDDDVRRAHDALKKAIGDAPVDRARPPGESLPVAFERYLDALELEAGWLERWAPVSGGERGDFEAAIVAYERLLAELPISAVDRRRTAENALKRIRDPELFVTGGSFLPGAPVVVRLTARNVRSVDLLLYRLDLTCEPSFTSRPVRWDWKADLDPSGRVPVMAIREETRGTRAFARTVRELALPALPTGAYLLVAGGGALERRDLVQVTETCVVTLASEDGRLVFVADAESGAPIPNAIVTAWSSVGIGKDASVRRHSARAGPDGAAFLPGLDGYFLLTAVRGERGLVSPGSGYSTLGRKSPLRLLAIPDRPVYGRGGGAKVLLVARSTDSGDPIPPPGTELVWEIRSAEGRSVASGRTTLGRLGMAVAEFTVRPDTPPGPLSIHLSPEGTPQLLGAEQHLGDVASEAPRSFDVTIERDGSTSDPSPPEEPIPIVVRAREPDGRPLSAATVELLIGNRIGSSGWWGEGDERPWGTQSAKRVSLTTDREGKARCVLPKTLAEPLEYIVRARVRAGDREGTGLNSFRVSHERIRLTLETSPAVGSPAEDVALTVRARDVRGRPVVVEGLVTIERSTAGIALSREGRLLSADEMRRLAFGKQPPPFERLSVAPPDSLRLPLRTRDGEARVPVRLPEGVYSVRASTPDGGPDAASAWTRLWVLSDNACEPDTDLAIDFNVAAVNNPVMAGRPVALQITTPLPGRFVLVAVAARGFTWHELVYVPGTVARVVLPVPEGSPPRLALAATSVTNRRNWYASTTAPFVDVLRTGDPPSVRVTPERNDYRPGEEATVAIAVRDSAGRPADARVAVLARRIDDARLGGDADADPAGVAAAAPRLPLLRPPLQVETSLMSSPPAKMILGEDGRWFDERDLLWRAKPAAAAKGLSIPAPNWTPKAPNLPSPEPPPSERPSSFALPGPPSTVPLLFESDLAAPHTRVAFRLPEDPGRYEVRVFASLSNGSFAEARATFSTARAPVHLSLETASWIRPGDRSVVSVSATNTTRERQEASFELSGEGIDGETRRSVIEGGDTVRVSFATTVSRATSVAVKTSGAWGSVSASRPVAVVDDDVAALEAVSGAGDERIVLVLPKPAPRRVHLTIAKNALDACRRALTADLYRDDPLGAALSALRLARAEGGDVETYREIVREAARSLDSARRDDGGFAPFPGCPSEGTTTALVLTQLSDARREGAALEENRAQAGPVRFLRAHIASLRGAPLVSALLALGERHAVEKAREVSEEEGDAFDRAYRAQDALAPADLARLARAARSYGFLSTADDLTRALVDLAGKSLKRSSPTFTTLDLAELVLALDVQAPSEEVNRLRRALLARWNGNGWGASGETIAAIAALLHGRTIDGEAGTFEIEGGVPAPGASTAGELEIAEGAGEIMVRRSCTGAPFVAAVSWRREAPLPEPETGSLSLARTIERNGTTIWTGEDVVEVLRFESRDALGPVRLVDRRPAGLVPAKPFQSKRPGIHLSERSEGDAEIVELSEAPAGVTELRRPLRAQHAGRFRWPAVCLGPLQGLGSATCSGAEIIEIHLRP